MNRLLPVLAAVALAGPAAAQDYGAPPPDGGGQAEASVWRDSRGDVVQGYRDGEGNSVYRDNRGRVVTGHTDGEGNSIWRNERGETVVGHTEATGDSAHKDRYGRTIRCRSYGYGRKICR